MHEFEANLNVIQAYKEAFGVLVGYSDHSQGINVSPYAVAAGARLVEKHFTLDTSAPGPDHRASLSPEALISYVKQIRRVDRLMGLRSKVPAVSEMDTRKSLQKCLVARRRLSAGAEIRSADFVAKRTGGIGIPPYLLDSLEGRILIKTLEEDDILTSEAYE
jgi:N,N'-diacetyllegionaminate synthase